MGVIYKITSPSNKVYVGKTYDLRKRIACHKHASKKGTNVILHNSIKKYGWDAHKLEIIETIEDEKLNEREIFWIAELKTYCHENPYGLNMTKGGEGQRSTWMYNLERRNKQIAAFTAEGNPFFGKKHSDQTKRLMGEKATKRLKETNQRVPEWGAEKGREKIRKEVIVYNSEGIFLGEYISVTIAAKELNIKRPSVSESLIYGSWVNGTYLFKYKTENYPLKIEVGDIKKKTEKRPVYYLFNSYIIEYSGAEEAAQELGIPKTTINRAACYNKLKPIRSGHVFIYKDLYEKVA